MAKIEEDEPADTGGWINTFADLMNLLLCFFVLLFSMSTVDAQKYEAVVKSMSESINIFDGGGESIGQGPFIDSGTDQVVAISQYFNEFESSGEDPEATEDQSNQQPGESASEQGEHNDQGGQKSDDGQNKSDDTQAKDNGQQSQDQQPGATPIPGQQDQNQDGKTQDPEQGGKQQDSETGQQGQQTEQNPQSKNDQNKTGDNIDKATVAAVEAQKEAEQKAKNEEAYEEIMKAAEDKNVEDDITVQMDKKNQYVQITMNGALLFDSGKATLRSSVKPILSKVGDILKNYKGNRIQILGHTDAVPMHSAEFPNNLWLSMARATAVFEYMTDVKKLDAHNLETTGRGEYDPIASNGTAAGRAKNRRVEFRIYTNK
ncbi:MAG: flagellar motor protein MotB [Eubacterium sp.]|nr:flagellar motor protein MotB [Eubacterium sp.]